jgi:mannose-6-phosphate isomerase
VHAIGAGLTLCEIQQYSDVTYRLYDYGRPRELHLDQALVVSRLGAHAARCQPRGNLLVSCPYFTTSKLCIHNTSKRLPASQSFQLLVLIEGSGALDGQSTRAGDVWYLEAGEFSGNADLLQVSP